MAIKTSPQTLVARHDRSLFTALKSKVESVCMRGSEVGEESCFLPSCRAPKNTLSSVPSLCFFLESSHFF